MAVSKMIVTVFLMSLVALAGCSDDNNAVTPAAPVDTAPPAAPLNLAVAFDGDAASLSWGENTVDADLAGYIVVRENAGQSQVLVSSPTMINAFVDPAPLRGATQYHVYAVDESGNESAVSTTYLSISSDKPVELQRQ